MISPEKKEQVLSKISEIEKSVSVDGQSAIGNLCENIRRGSIELTKSSDSIFPILRTALVINWRESAMISRYDRFRSKFPEVTTLSDLKRVMDSTDPLVFCKEYLNINANSSAPDKNPKYCLLKELTNGFLDYQNDKHLSSEIEAIRDWAASVRLSDLKNDHIGKRHGVGPGVVENIRLNLGMPVVKPDRHVIGVMEKFLEVDIPLDGYNDFAREIGQDPRYFDCLLFEYGKAKKISASECADSA